MNTSLPQESALFACINSRIAIVIQVIKLLITDLMSHSPYKCFYLYMHGIIQAYDTGRINQLTTISINDIAALAAITCVSPRLRNLVSEIYPYYDDSTSSLPDFRFD